MRNLTLLFLFALLIASCTDKNDAIDESFYGTIPCADCPGIEYELHLHNDNTFNESSLYLDRTEEAITEDGTYSIENDSIIVLDRGQNDGFDRLLIRGESLIILNSEGKEIEGVLAPYYILSKEKPEISKATEVATEYSFKASGNEPFWNVGFGEDNKIYIAGMLGENQISYSFPMPEAKELNEHAKSYHLKNETLEMDLLVLPQSCADTMADNIFTHKVSLQLKLAQWEEFQDLQGCGEYIGIHQLQSIWLLSSINGEEISENNRNAHLQFDVGEGVFFGNGGCNNINGNFEYTETTITFGTVAATLMTCENQEEESKFITKLEGFTYDIQLSRDDLTLSNSENQLTFKRLE